MTAKTVVISDRLTQAFVVHKRDLMMKRKFKTGENLTAPRLPHRMDVKNQSRANFKSWLNTSWNVNLVFSWVALKLSKSFVINFKSPPFLLCQCNTWSAAQCHFCIFLGLHFGSPQLSTHSKSPPWCLFSMSMQHLIHDGPQFTLVEPSYCQPCPGNTFFVY